MIFIDRAAFRRSADSKSITKQAGNLLCYGTASFLVYNENLNVYQFM